MRFGIFFEHQLPRPWEDGAEQKLIADALDQVELADRVGFDSVWEVEHHFLEEYSHSSASDVFLAAASQRTKNIRLGFGILPLPPGYQHPARVAETVSMLDLVSGGRVEFGTGETSSGAELEGFGVERETKREQWDEALDVITRMMVEEPFAGWDGRFGSMPPRNVIPKPVQKPHPPLWVACSRRETIKVAAEKGIGALTFSFIEPEEAKEWVDEYRAIIASERCVPGGFAVNPRIAVVLPMMLHHDEQTAIDRGIDGGHFFGYSLAHYYVFGDHHPGRTNIYEEFLARRNETGFSRDIITADKAPLGIKILQQGLGSLRGAVGTPDQVRELCERYEKAGVDQLIFVLQAGKNRHEHICESIELFGKEVLPEFAARADAADAAVDEQLAGAIEAALARRPPPRTADPNYTISPSAGGTPKRGQAPILQRERKVPVPVLAREWVVEAGEKAFGRLVRGASDKRLERVMGTKAALRLFFGGMAARFDPSKAAGFSGELQFDLRTGSGAVRRWTVEVDGDHAHARAGGAKAPALTVRVGLADFLRISARELDPGKALLAGRLDVEGDFELMTRLGEMFGEPSPF
jgi:alkanesulfonate monooxygenase SsuD/methylene tetrahydromethanopterin reductase-like flavin-dependent oxidoreductase (luciferase family)/putative sterol carrier protein